MQRCLSVHSAGGQWPLRCPRHFGVNIGFVILVQRTTCTGTKGNAQDRRKGDDGVDIARRGQQTT